MIKEMFESKLGVGNIPKLEELVETAKNTKEMMEQVENGYTDVDDSFDDYVDENLPRHYYGEDEELIFEDEFMENT